MTAKKLIKLEQIVKPILERSITARNDDFFLYSEVIKEFKPELSDVPLLQALRCHNELGLPNYDSVARARRKVQEKNPELESERTRRRRLKEAEEYKEYARIS